jgi:UDP-glucose 4-epimerase
MKLLITGGCGYIGSILSRRALEVGHEVVAVDNGSRKLCHTPQGATYIFSDVRESAGSWVREVSPDVVIHLAAKCSVPEGEVETNSYYSVNALGSCAIASALRDSGVPAHFVYAGSCAQVPPSSWYGLTKAAGEQAIRHILPAERVTTLRLFNVAGAAYGIREPSGPYGRIIPNAVDAARNSVPIEVRANGIHVRDFVHVLDVAQAFILAVDKRPSGIFEVGSGKGTSTSRVLDMIEFVGRRRIERLFMAGEDHVEAAMAIANPTPAAESLGWSPTKTLEDCVRSVLEAS